MEALRDISRQPLVLHGSAYALLAGIHWSLVWCMRYPTIFYDEAIYLGFARYFAGVSHVLNLTGGASGHFGYALLLAPAFKLAPGFHEQYLLALCINGLLMSTSYLSLYYLISRMTVLPRNAAIAIAFATCLYPSFFLFSKFVVTENAFVPVFLLVPVSLLRLLEGPTIGKAALAGGAAGAAYVVHSRGSSVLLGGAVLLVVLVLLRRMPWHLAALALAIMAGAYTLTNRENLRLLDLGYSGTGLPQSGAALAYLKSPSGRYAAFEVLAGEIVYLLQATYCLFFAGWAGMIVQAWRLPGRASRGSRIAVTVFLVAAGISIACGAAIFIGSQDPFHRADHLLIGRYNEGAAAIFIAFALALVWRAASDRGARWLLIQCYAAGAVTLVCLTLVLPAHPERLAISSVNSLANVPLIQLVGGTDLRRATLAALAISACLILVFLYKRLLAIGFLAALFLLSGLRTFGLAYSQRMLPWNARPTRLAGVIARSGATGTVDYDMSAWSPSCYASYQLELPGARFDQFRSAQGGTPKSGVVIAGEQWKDGPRLGFTKVDHESSADQALWVRASRRDP
jgi:hypothetical protein